MNRALAPLTIVLLAGSLVMAGCAGVAPSPTPTKAPAVPTKAAAATKAAEPTKAPVPQPTAAPKKVEFPVKGRAITMIIPWDAGGSPDVGGRILAASMEKVLGTPVQVVNKPGAGSQIGLTELANARPDGYTIGITMSPSTMASYLDPARKATYNRRSFEPIAHFDYEPYLVAVLPSSPHKSTKDLVAAAKASPGMVKVGSPGILSGPHLGWLLLAKAAAVDFAIVQFQSGGQVSTALLGGHVDTAAFGAGAIAAQHKSGAVRLIGIMDPEESKSFPGVNTLQSEGYKVVLSSGYGLSAPAGTPKEIVEVLSDAVKKAYQDEDLKKKMADLGRVPRYLDATAYGRLWEELDTELKPLVEEVTKK